MTARRFGSVCSGIEAASVAFGQLGWEAAWLAEVDVAASQVLAHHYGASAPRTPLPGSEKLIARLRWGDHVVNYGDMTTLPGLVRSGNAEAPDILCGGTPCQAFSIAGRREGLADARGQLTLSFVDLADAIDDVRAERGDHPCTIIWENVPGVLSDKDNAFGCFLAALAGEDLPLVPSGKRWPDAGLVLGPQRAVAWRIGDAQHFGLAQRRRRVFLVASAREGFDPGNVLFEFDGLRRDTAPRREAGESVAGTLDARSTGGGFPGTDGATGGHVVAVERPDLDAPTWWDGSPVSQTLDAVLHKGQTMPEKNRFPAVLQPTVYSIMPMNSGKDYKARVVEVVQPLMAAGPVGGNQGGDFVVQSVAPRAAAGGGSDPSVPAHTGPIAFAQNSRDEVRLQNGDGSISGALGANEGMKQRTYVAIPILEAGARTGASTTDIRAGMGVGQDGDPMFTLQSSKQYAIAFTSKDWGQDATEDLSPTMRSMAHGASHANGGGQLAVCITGEITHTLKAEGFDGSEDGSGRGQPIVAAAMAVRRLMPVECERLQGFPDNYTLVPVGKKMAADGPRYKQLGNSWAVPHARWVGSRVAAELDRLDRALTDALSLI